MVTFDLAGRDVGPRVVQSIRRAAAADTVALTLGKARFVAALDLTGASVAFADFTEAEFPRGIRLADVTFQGEVCFDRATGSDLWLDEANFLAGASFRGLGAANLRIQSTTFERYASFDGANLGFGNFRDVVFQAEARFRKASSRGHLTFRSVRFAAAASFHNSVIRDLAFPGCDFEGPFQCDDLEVLSTASFVGSRFANTRSLGLRAGQELVLRDVRFAQPVVLAAATPLLHADSACFERGADVLLEPGAKAGFAQAAFLGPSLISTRRSGEERPAKVTSLDRARAERLTLEGLDLAECSLGTLHRLDDVLVSGRGQLALAPAVVESSYRREILADEALRRAGGSRMLQWAPISWTPPPTREGEEALDAQAIADTYRAMRKAREDSHDYPGAADFYYGEMEMRREGAEAAMERLILNLYWLTSGYGMRAGRAVLTYLLVVLLLAAGFQTIGLDDPPSFLHTLGWTMTASVSLTRSIEKMDVTTAGLYLSTAARIFGPALIGLTVLALRSRVRR